MVDSFGGYCLSVVHVVHTQEEGWHIFVNAKYKTRHPWFFVWHIRAPQHSSETKSPGLTDSMVITKKIKKTQLYTTEPPITMELRVSMI